MATFIGLIMNSKCQQTLMKKQLLISLSILSLVACTEETDDIYGTVDPQNKAFYSYDLSAANESNKLTKKSYQVDKNNDLLITYTETPKLQTEALRNLLS